MTGDALRSEISDIAGELRELAVFLDTTPRPEMPGYSVKPFRGPPGRMERLPPGELEGIKEAVRIANENYQAEWDDYRMISGCLEEAERIYTGRLWDFMSALIGLSASGVLSIEEADTSFADAQPPSGPWRPGDERQRNGSRAQLTLRIIRLWRWKGEFLQKEVASIAAKIANLATVLDTVPAADAAAPGVHEWLHVAERTHSDMMRDFRRELDLLSAQGILPNDSAAAALDRAARTSAKAR